MEIRLAYDGLGADGAVTPSNDCPRAGHCVSKPIPYKITYTDGRDSSGSYPTHVEAIESMRGEYPDLVCGVGAESALVWGDRASYDDGRGDDRTLSRITSE